MERVKFLAVTSSIDLLHLDPEGTTGDRRVAADRLVLGNQPAQLSPQRRRSNNSLAAELV